MTVNYLQIIRIKYEYLFLFQSENKLKRSKCRLKNEKQNNHKPPKIIVKESFLGLKSVQDLFSDIILSELTDNSKMMFSEKTQSSIMNETYNSQNKHGSKRLLAYERRIIRNRRESTMQPSIAG